MNAAPAGLTLKPRFSARLAAILAGAHLAALAALSFPGIPLGLTLGGAFAVAASFVYFWRRDLTRSGPTAIQRAEWDAEGAWTLWDARGRRFEARLLEDRFVHPQLVVLNFALNGWRRRRLVLDRPALDADMHRRLRMRLNVQRAEAPTPWAERIRRFRVGVER